MGRTVTAYEGNQPYIFVSYSHKDEDKVLPIIRKLQRRGYRIWFDRGIHGAEKWRRKIAIKVNRCSAFLMMVSKNYDDSEWCQKEFNYAQDIKRSIVAIFLEDEELSPELQFALAGPQHLMPDKTNNEKEFWNFIDFCDALACCKEEHVPETKGFSIQEFLLSLWPEKALCQKACIAGIMLILAVLALWRTPAKEPEVPVQTATPTETQATVPSETAAPVTTAPQTLSGNVLMEVPSPAESENLQDAPAFNTGITRKEVGSIWFTDLGDGTLANAEEAVDVSQNQDGSVLAWTVKDGDLYQLHIAGKGGVDAPVNSANLFRDMVNVTQIYFFDAFFTGNAESMMAMFYNCENLFRVDVSGFNTAKVKDFGWMFANCQSLDELDVSSFDTSRATRMACMFYDCKNVWQLDLRNFCTENVTNMKGMFCQCENLLSVNLESFDTANVKNMYAMFSHCRALTQLDVSGFDTANVTDMSHMFQGCESLLTLDVSGFDTSKVADMGSMFEHCEKLRELDVSGFDTRHVTDMSYMFNGCSNLEELDLSSFKTFNVTDMSYMFYNDIRLENLDFSGFNTDKVTNFERFMLENQKINGIPWQGLFANSSK